MFVCNCNGLTESDAKEAIERGACQWDHVHAFHGCEPCCGMCQDEIEDMMTDAGVPVLLAAE